jgi:hypothetical protein
MALFIKIRKPSGLADSIGPLDVKIDVVRTLAILITGVVVLSGALLLYLHEEDSAAAAFFSLGEALLVGGLGIVTGERSGAMAAGAELR